MSDNNNHALVAWAAEHVMGWKCYHVGKQGDDELTDDYQAVVFYDKDGGKVTSVSKWDDHSSLDMEPWNPLTDANDDLEVLRKVRESASDSERVRFAYVLSDIWLERDVTAIDGCWWLAHEIGDYTRAAAKAKGWTEQ